MPYALINYNTNNLGDVLQTEIARSFLPSVDAEIGQKTITKHPGFMEPHKAIWCGYFDDRNEFFIPKNIRPLFVSWHATARNKAFLDSLKVLHNKELLKTYAPIGCRDMFTVRLMEKLGIEAYFSGCLTTLIQKQGLEKEDYILCVDVPKEVIEFLRWRTKRPIVTMTKNTTNYNKINELQKLTTAIEKAHCVISPNLHTSIPAAALGTELRVLLPTGTLNVRLMGWENYLPIVRPEDFVKNYDAWDVERHIEKSSLQTMQTNLKSTIENFVNEA